MWLILLRSASLSASSSAETACAGGLVIEHRPEVVQRRATEARQRQLEEQAVTDRRRRQDALDEQHGPKSRRIGLPGPETSGGAGRSRYIESGGKLS